MSEIIYIDTCVLNRPSDDHTQPRIKQESEALGRILDLVHNGVVRWFSSVAVTSEIDRNPHALRRIRALNLLTAAHTSLIPNPVTVSEATRLISLGLTPMDALHLALAHGGGVDSLLTTDDRFLRLASRQLPAYRPQVINPVDWLQRRQLWRLRP